MNFVKVMEQVSSNEEDTPDAYYISIIERSNETDAPKGDVKYVTGYDLSSLALSYNPDGYVALKLSDLQEAGRVAFMAMEQGFWASIEAHYDES